MTTRRCTRCQRTFEGGDYRFCPHDGAALIELTPPKPATPSPLSADTSGPDRASMLTRQILDGKYQILRKLGEGGMSYVYLGLEMGQTEPVAIKVLSPRLSGEKTSVERLRREATLAMKLDHPNACTILRLGESSDGLIYLVMPYLNGELLSDREVKRGPFPVEEGLPILLQIARGLDHAHQLGIIHRDLKPENVMLVGDPSAPNELRAVVMDFGLAKERQAGPEVQKLTATGIVLGTPEFMSPEQIRGRTLDARSDLYALGILGFELFTGQLPFQGRSAQEMMIARLRGQPLKLRAAKPELPAALETVIARALATEPDQRYPTMTEFARALAEVGGTGVFTKVFGATR